MQKNTDKAINQAEVDTEARTEVLAYATPTIYLIGQSNELLKGSGRHKNDDTGSRGFIVDQR